MRVRVRESELELYIAQTYGQKRVRRKLYAMMYNVCNLFVLGFDLCIMKYHVKCNAAREDSNLKFSS